MRTNPPRGPIHRAAGAVALSAALGIGATGSGALADATRARTVGAWTVECHQTEAGGRQCSLRNAEDGKPALEQRQLLSLTLHDGATQAEGLIRIADLELPPRLAVEIAFGGELQSLEGVGRRGRLAARFTLQLQELPRLAAAEAITVRFADQNGQAHEIAFATQGLTEALEIAADFL